MAISESQQMKFFLSIKRTRSVKAIAVNIFLCEEKQKRGPIRVPPVCATVWELLQ